MYLLVDEDRGEPSILERRAPWGAPDADAYVARLERALGELKSQPSLKLNFEVSGCELESLAKRYPTVLSGLRAAVVDGRVEVVGGDFSQAHHHVLSGESSLRQYVYGVETIERLLGCSPVVAFHQEPGHHSQLPQILSAVGIGTAVVPGFPWLLTVTRGSIQIVSWPRDDYEQRLYFPPDQSVVTWEGLDGSSLPLYLRSQLRVTVEELLSEDQRGEYHSAALWIWCPDMEEASQEGLAYLLEVGAAEFVTMSEGLKLVMENCLPEIERAVVALEPCWSYVEGMWCEQLLVVLREAEQAILAAESADALLTRGSSHAMRDEATREGWWRDLLKLQHHDIMWVETTDLKRRAIQSCRDLTAVCKSAATEGLRALCVSEPASVAGSDSAVGRLTILGQHPYGGDAVVSLERPPWWPAEAATIVTSCGVVGRYSEYSCNGRDYLELVLPLDGMGVRQFEIRVRGLSDSKRGMEADIANSVACRLTSSGVGVRGRGGVELLEEGSGTPILGMRLHDRASVSEWLPVESYTTGAMLSTQVRSEVAGIEASVRLLSDTGGLGILEYEFDCQEGRDIGVMWDDYSKVVLPWRFANYRGDITYDIPFGIATRKGRGNLFANSWIAHQSGHGGVLVVQSGHPRFITDGKGVVFSPLLWGSREFTNRMSRRFAETHEYDLRLKGLLRCSFVIKAIGDEPAWQLARYAQYAANRPTVLLEPIDVALPAVPEDVMTVGDGLLATSVATVGQRLRIRVVNLSDRPVAASAIISQHCARIAGPVNVLDLHGAAVETVRPFQVCNVLL